jgi:predicted dehydrogenase
VVPAHSKARVTKKAQTPPQKFDYPDRLAAGLQHFLNRLQDGHEPLTGSQSALNVLRVLEACQISLEGGSWK